MSRHGVFKVSRRVSRGFSADKLIAARLGQGLSRGELARRAKINITPGTIRAWEVAGVSPGVDKLEAVLAVLGLRPKDVIEIEPDERFLGDLRVIHGRYTQHQLAQTIGISPSAISTLERGESPLTGKVAAGIAHALQIPVEEVVAAYERTRDRPAGSVL